MLLDLIRGIAAVVVLLEHGRNTLFVDYGDIAAHRSWFALPYLVTGAGHQAVVIFFALSGYLIGGSVFRSLRTNQWSWASYLTHRLVRLWVVLLPGLFSCLLLDWLGMHFDQAPALYAGKLSSMVPNVPLGTSVSIFLGNLFFVHTILVPVLGSNTALWSLAYEFWYYMLFPLLWLGLVYRGTKMPLRILFVSLTVAIGFFVTLPIRANFPIWLFGAVLALLPIPRFARWVRAVAAVLYIPLFFLTSTYNPFVGHIPYPYLWMDYALGLMTVAFFWIMLSASTPAEDTAFTRFSRGLSRFSFSLYVLHFPVIVILTALLLGERRWQPTPGYIIVGIAICALAALYSRVLAGLTEFRTDVLRKWVERRLHLVQQPKSSPHERALHGS